MLVILGVGALAAPFGLLAQQPRIPRIGFLEPLSRDYAGYAAFLRGLRELGYTDGKNIAIEARFAEGNLERLPALAGELVKLKLDAIVTVTTPGVRAVRQATTTIPIVMLVVGNPVGDGLVASLARPGGNITGLSNLASDTIPKLLEMLKAVLPKLSRVAVLVNPANAQNAGALKNIQEVARQMNLTIAPVEARNPKEIENVFAAMTRQRPDALIVVGDPIFRSHAPEIGRLALRHKLPFASPNRDTIETGGLLSYGADITDIYWRGAGYVDKILKGAKPADLPVEQPTQVGLVINLKTAKILGINVPQDLRLRAIELIE